MTETPSSQHDHAPRDPAPQEDSATDPTQPMPSVAFLGLGNMGGPMAANLAAAGIQVRGYDVVPAAMDAAREFGVRVVEDTATALAEADVVLTMLPSGAHVKQAYQGDDDASGLLAEAKPGAIFLDCSTINISEAQEAAAMARAAGFQAAEAPVSGGVVGAEAGSLAFMVGATEEVFSELHPLLEIMGARVVRCGEAGMGQAAKICNNMILGVSTVVVSEAFVLAEQLGLSHQAMYDVVSGASGQCWSLTTNCPVPGPVPASPANREYAPGFAGALMAKDLTLATNALEETGVDARMGQLAAEIYRTFAEGEGAGQDFSGIINTIRENSEA